MNQAIISDIRVSGKRSWDEVTIPDALKYRIESVIENTPEVTGKLVKKNTWKPVVAVAAASVCAFTVALNTNEAFAKDMSNVPVIGNIAKILTIRSYNEKSDDVEVTLEQPAIQAENGISNKMAEEINQEIERYMEDYIKQAKKEVLEYKRAFLETGGTEEEFKEKKIKIEAAYDVKNINTQYVSFAIYGYEDWNASTYTEKFYNLVLPDLTAVSLEDLLGSDYKEIATNSIKRQMKEQMEADDSIQYFSEGEGGFSSVDENTKFYINESGNPVILFSKYEVAPGSMGEPEFEITKGLEVQNTSDLEGASSLSDSELSACEAVMEAVENKDLNALAALTEYPFYFGKGEGEVIASKEQFEKRNPDDIFTDELVSSVLATDLSTLEESNAGLILGDEKANIIVSIKDGLKVSGMNYN